MLTLRYLLVLIATVVMTTVAALVVSNAVQNTNPYIKSVALAISATSHVKAKEPVAVTTYRVYYSTVGERLVLTERPVGRATPPLFALGLGLCGDVKPLLNKTYTPSNNTIHTTHCSYLLPAVEENVITHYLPLCREGTDFAAEVAELEIEGWRIRLVVIKC